MRNRFHKEPVDPNNIIRPDQAGTKENPDYVVNIQGNSKTHIVPHIDKVGCVFRMVISCESAWSSI